MRRVHSHDLHREATIKSINTAEEDMTRRIMESKSSKRPQPIVQ